MEYSGANSFREFFGFLLNIDEEGIRASAINDRCGVDYLLYVMKTQTEWVPMSLLVKPRMPGHMHCMEYRISWRIS